MNACVQGRGLELFNRYSRFLVDEFDFYFDPLRKVGVPPESGKLVLRSDNDATVGALRFRFFFFFNKKVVIHLDGGLIHFLPGEEIKLLTIRVYHSPTFIKFFTEHDFALLNQHKDGTMEQFLFRHEEHKNRTGSK